jgi:hypothetical protein
LWRRPGPGLGCGAKERRRYFTLIRLLLAEFFILSLIIFLSPVDTYISLKFSKPQIFL